MVSGTMKEVQHELTAMIYMVHLLSEHALSLDGPARFGELQAALKMRVTQFTPA